MIFSNVSDSQVDHNEELLELIVKLLKPKGKFLLKNDKRDEMKSSLILSGFVNIEFLDNNSKYLSLETKLIP